MSTTLGGLGAGVLASFCAFLAFNYFFIPPYYTLIVHQTQDLLVLVVFLGVAVFISQLMGRAQSSLAGLPTENAIARAVAERVQEVFQAQAVQLLISARPPEIPHVIEVPAGSPAPARAADFSLALTTTRGQMGELRLWRAEPVVNPTEERLLQTFASQGALALEHARLSKVETQANILEESDRLKSALLSSVSHELRTPLATIKAAATSLRGGEVDWSSPARDDLLAAVDEEADHLNRLVGNLLDMSRIEAGALKPQRQWNSLAEIVGATLTRMRRAIEPYRLEIDVSDDLPLVPVDPVQLDTVFTNLISNSLKYAPPNTTVGVRAWELGGQALQVMVSNQGPPVAEAHLEHIFDKFFRVTAADRVTGTGLGLSICKGIVEAHGGRIWAENLPEGFGFSFTLPLTWDGVGPPRLPAGSETL